MAVEELPQTSVAVHVRVTVKLLAQVPAVVTLLNVRVGVPLHASVAVAVAKLGEAGQLIVEGAGNAAITGDVTS